jgi:hypothetical protein
VAAASLALLAAGPAFAADPVARASATALQIGIAGQGTDTGTYTATNDGSTETTSGTNTPALPVLGGQRLTNLGTLAQDATTTSSTGNGSSAACAGVAGEGATLAQVGDGSSCLTGGQTVSLDAGHLDLTNLRVLDNEALEQLAPGVTSQILGPVSAALKQVFDALGDPAIGVDLGAVQASCTASPTSARGGANVADASVYLQAPAPIGRVELVALPVHPAPNTHVVTDLSAVAEAVQRAVDTQLATAIGGQAGPLGPVLGPLRLTVDQVIDQVQANVTDALGPQLAPLEQNVVDIELNHQDRRANAIDVTALDLSLLPAAKQFVDSDLVSLVIGKVSCGPNGRVGLPAPTPAATPAVDHPAPPASDDVPTAVESGAGSLEHGPSPLALAGLAGLVVAGVGAGAWGFRRTLER